MGMCNSHLYPHPTTSRSDSSMRPIIGGHLLSATAALALENQDATRSSEVRARANPESSGQQTGPSPATPEAVWRSHMAFRRIVVRAVVISVTVTISLSIGRPDRQTSRAVGGLQCSPHVPDIAQFQGSEGPQAMTLVPDYVNSIMAPNHYLASREVLLRVGFMSRKVKSDVSVLTLSNDLDIANSVSIGTKITPTPTPLVTLLPLLTQSLDCRAAELGHSAIGIVFEDFLTFLDASAGQIHLMWRLLQQFPWTSILSYRRGSQRIRGIARTPPPHDFHCRAPAAKGATTQPMTECRGKTFPSARSRAVIATGAMAKSASTEKPDTRKGDRREEYWAALCRHDEQRSTPFRSSAAGRFAPADEPEPDADWSLEVASCIKFRPPAPHASETDD
ncbi:hypothetical protein AXG93_812s1130 [Marchantia polymorpha subsp. ruderalis]|uniref:Uncharacterized protein n=1 Tax=Marchantia polymorpha subsp. ruderalis TaxID=1480154 RepID=A0A176VXS7_MARPO|nr:hypothetical protein AXG93_812s1130 [Marchantia polymorpha subsp. ruderalis]